MGRCHVFGLGEMGFGETGFDGGIDPF